MFPLFDGLPPGSDQLVLEISQLPRAELGGFGSGLFGNSEVERLGAVPIKAIGDLQGLLGTTSNQPEQLSLIDPEPAIGD